MSYSCSHTPPCVNSKHHVSRFYCERAADAISRNGMKNGATFLNTPEELRDAGIIDAEQADKLIAERDAGVM